MAEPTVRATDASGKTWDDPDATALHDALADLNLRWRFLIVSRLDREPAGQHYMQAYINDDWSYQVEYRDGGADRHFEAYVPPQNELVGPEPVARVLAAYAADRPGWRNALDWRPRPPDA
ncbi:hypothetical protein [Dactylosporangium sp. NPDC049140]|jgi:hypothetical protein|uniref:hypothetical protein n=1 Tax=Dactylosporangium sp. NPDC049140 TaxID=3155647 RepID=UPI0033E7F3B4